MNDYEQYEETKRNIVYYSKRLLKVSITLLILNIAFFIGLAIVPMEYKPSFILKYEDFIFVGLIIVITYTAYSIIESIHNIKKYSDD